jgi:hypothetical protein
LSFGRRAEEFDCIFFVVARFVEKPQIIGNQPELAVSDNRPFRGTIDDVVFLRNDKSDQAMTTALVLKVNCVSREFFFLFCVA